jgi:predicted DNA-binding antitoxin AbrB/MazE fold protein
MQKNLEGKINMFLILINILIFSQVAFSGDKVVEMGAENYMSHGYSENVTKELAKIEACNNAKKELITYVFGAAFQINQNMIKSLGVMDLSQDVSLNTGEIVLRSAMVETSINEEVTKCTITYPILEAKIEKQRLKSVGDKVVKFTEIGDSSNMFGGTLEVLTTPIDTEVFVDNVRWGTTPLKLYGKLSSGTHLLRLDNPNYKIVEESIDIGLAKVRINKKLNRATGNLTIKTSPEGASVKINEEFVGHSPINKVELLAGQKLKIEISHSEAETIVQNITLMRDESKTIDQKLLLKSGFISLNVVPNKKIVIKIDDKTKNKLPLNSWIQLPAGNHEVFVSSKGYAENVTSINVVGGEKTAIPTIFLVPLEDSLPPADMKSLPDPEDYNIKNVNNVSREVPQYEKAEVTNQQAKSFKPWRVGLSGGISGSPLKGFDSVKVYGIQLGYQIFRYFGFDSQLSFFEEKKEFSNATLTTTGRQSRLGFPIYFTNNFSMAPEFILSNQSFKAEDKKTKSSFVNSHSQFGKGWSMSYSVYSESGIAEGSGIEFRVGKHKFNDVDGLKGAAPLSFSISLGVKW